MKTYKAGDHYPDWAKLESFKTKAAGRKVKTDDLVVRVTHGGLISAGRVSKITDLEESRITIGGRRYYSPKYFANNFALLPTSPSKTPKTSKRPQIEVVQDKVVKFSDSGTSYCKSGISMSETITREMKPKEALELAKKIRREVARHKKLKF